MLETKFKYTAGKAFVTPQEQQKSPQEQQEQLDIQQDTHNTQMPSTPPQPNPQPIATQTSEQRAPRPAAPERFKQKVDYKYDSLCRMRYLSKLDFNTVDRSLMISPLSASLVKLQH